MRTILVKMDVHNAYRKCKEDEQHSPRNINPAVLPYLVPLFAELTKKRPTWTFVTDAYGDYISSRDCYEFNRFTIMDGDEPLGTVWGTKNWRTGENRFAFDSPRLRVSRSRGNCSETKDLKKAVKVITANMYTRTLPEILNEARKTAVDKLSSKSYDVQRRYRYATERLTEAMVAFAMDNWEAFKASVPDRKNDLDALVECRTNAEAMQVVERRKLQHALVVERSGKFHVEYASDPTGTSHTYTLLNLPSALREAVGVLKLVEDNTLVEDIGLRANASTFIAFNGHAHE
jgi:hypothetical protein